MEKSIVCCYKLWLLHKLQQRSYRDRLTSYIVTFIIRHKYNSPTMSKLKIVSVAGFVAVLCYPCTQMTFQLEELPLSCMESSQLVDHAHTTILTVLGRRVPDCIIQHCTYTSKLHTSYYILTKVVNFVPSYYFITA